MIHPWPSSLLLAGRLALLLLVVVPTSSHAGAWLQSPGAVYFKTSWLRSQTSTGLDCRGQVREVDEFGGRYQVNQVLSYVEWGARDWLTLVGSWSVQDQRITEARIPEYGTRSTGDLHLGARFPLLRGRVPVSAQWTTIFPTYRGTDLGAPVADRTQYLPAGSGQVEFEPSLQAGLSLYPLPLYSGLELGYRHRGGDFGDEWLLRAELGVSSPRFFAKAEIGWILPTGDPCASSSVGGVSLQQRLVRFSPELAVRARGNLWVNLGLTTVVSGRNTLDGEQLSLGFSWIRR